MQDLSAFDVMLVIDAFCVEPEHVRYAIAIRAVVLQYFSRLSAASNIVSVEAVRLSAISDDNSPRIETLAAARDFPAHG